MEWIIYALLAAVFTALARVLVKTSRDSKSRTIVFSRYIYGLLPALIFLFFLGIPESIGQSFYYFVILGSIFDVAGLICLTLSIEKSEFSKSLPFISFTPVFIILTGFLILGEVPSLLGIVGIFTIVIGAYWLSYSDHTSNRSFIEPFKSLYEEPGPKYMFAAAFFFSLTGVFFKKVVLVSSPIFGVTSSFFISSGGIFLFYTFYHFFNKEKSVKDLFPNKKDFLKLFFLGILSFGVLFSVFTAIETGLVSYVASIKRISVILGVAIGAMFFKEKGALRHIIGTAIMVAGAVLIALT